MAYLTDHSNSFGALIASVWTTVANATATFLSDVRNAGTRSEAIQELQAMDDVTLKAKHGITRSQIIGYVFSDKLLP